MSSSSKVVVWVIVILVILIGGFIYFTHISAQGAYPPAAATTTGDVDAGIPPRNYDQDTTVSAGDTSDTSGSATDPLDNDSVGVGASASSTQ